MTQNAKDQQPRTKEAANMSDENERSVASTGSVEGDIVTRLRSTRADMIGTCDEQHYNDCQEAADEIASLRDVMYRVVDEDCTVAIQNGCFYADGEPLFSVPCSRTSERTAAAHATPGEGTEQSECRLRDSRNAYGPVAFGIECEGELLAAYTCEDEESAAEMVERFAATGMTGCEIVPLFRKGGRAMNDNIQVFLRENMTNDIVARLYDEQFAAPAWMRPTIHEAAAEIARLREHKPRLMLTDEEREAIDFAWCSVGRDDAFNEQHAERIRETLQQLLERTK